MNTFYENYFINYDEAIELLEKLKNLVDDDEIRAGIESLRDVIALEKINIDAWNKDLDVVNRLLMEQGLDLTQI